MLLKFHRFAILIILCILGNAVSLVAQTGTKSQIDSFETVLKTSHDTGRVITLYRLSHLYLYNNPRKSLSLGMEALTLATKLDFQKGIASSHNSLGNYYYQTGDYKQAIIHHRASLTIRKKMNDNMGIAQSLVNLGNANYSEGKLKDATNTYFEGLKYSELAKNDGLTSMLYTNIASIFDDLKNFQQSLEYSLKAISIREKINDVGGLAFNYNNISTVYRDSHKYNEAITYLKKAIEASVASGNSNLQAYALTNLGDVYARKGMYLQSIENLEKSRAIQEQLGDKLGYLTTLTIIGDTYYAARNLQKAEWYYRNALDGNRNLKNANVLLGIYEGLTKVCEAENKYAEALKFNKLLSAQKDSTLNETNTKQLSELNTKYETEKKQKEIVQLSSQNTTQKLVLVKRNTTIIAISSIFITSIAFGLLFYIHYKTKQEKKLQAEIIRQQDLSTQAVLEAEEKERTRIGNDLHDGLGQLFSTVKMNLSGLIDRVSIAHEDDRILAEKTVWLVDESCREVRSISHQMMPNALLKAGLAAGVRNFLTLIDENHLKVNLETVGFNDRINSNVEMVLYRVIQETVNNVIKHAAASQLDIQLVKDEDGINVTIEDNGKGFDTTQIEKQDGIGVKNIKTRVLYLKGTVDFDTAIGRGTVVNVWVPLT